MKRLLLIMVLSVAAISSCKKEESKLMINATATITGRLADIAGSDRVPCDIAIVPSDISVDVSSSETVSSFLKSYSGNIKRSVSQYSDYFPKGNYTIIMQINDPNIFKSYNGTYTYKNVSTIDDANTSNVMVFNESGDKYQVWKNKY